MLNKRLKELRIKRGYTQKELGGKIGVNDNTITNYEKGIRQPDYATLIKFAELFNCSTDYLLGRTNNQGEVLVPPERGQSLIGRAIDANVSPDELDAYIEARKKAQNIKDS